MSQLPRLESRIGAQERIATFLNARIEELSQDMTASFKQQVNYQIDFEHKTDAHFNEIDARFNKVDARLDKVDARLDKIEANMATKSDMIALESRVDARIVALETRVDARIVALETRMLDAFKQLIATIDVRLPPSPQKE